MVLECPGCKRGKLEEIEVDGVLIDRCKVCSGLWFDSGELTELVGDANENISDLEGKMPETSCELKCPRCENILLRPQLVFDANKEEAEIFKCPSCLGSWLDRGILRHSEDQQIAEHSRRCFKDITFE